MEKISVLVIGENCTDKFIYGDVNRLCPEAPVPVLNPKKVKKNPGMAGNVVENLKALNNSLDITFLHQKEKIVKTRYVDEKSNQMIIRVDEGEDLIERFEMTDDVIEKIKESDIVIISDYNKGFLSTETITLIGHHAKLSILDSKRKLTNEIIEGFTFVKLNESERINNPELTCDNIITTLGKLGAEYQNEVYESPNPQDTIDVSGAGDTFTASFIVKYYQLKDERAAIKFANRMAAEVVSKRGVAVPTERI